MMEPNDSPDVDSDIELPRVVVQNTSTTMGTMDSSLNIEQPLPTVAELRGKSDVEDNARPSRAALCILYMLPFMVVVIVVIVVVAVTQNNSRADLRNMTHDEAFTAVVEYLGNHNISGYPELIREGSFQNLAATWMAHGDTHSMSIPKGSPASKEGYAFIQRYIMTLLYYQMGGPQWKYDINFLQAQDTCDWSTWILREADKLPVGAICNSNKIISAIVLVGADVKGRFPYELGKLSTLRVIEMDVNQISGSIPESFQNLIHLENLHLSHNKITGTLPSYLGGFPDLSSVDVSFNLFDGALPGSLGTLPKLRGIAVDHNLFTGYPGFWGQDPQSNQQAALEYLFLEQNALDGTLEDQLFDRLPNLKVLDISGNQFNGAIPANIFRLTALEVLDLNSNSFSSTIPPITSNTALKFLALHKNELTGKIGEEIGNLQLLNHLDLSNNNLTGYVVNEQTRLGLPSLTQLSYLFLSANKFPADPFPAWVREIKQLEELSMKSLNLNDNIPTWLGELTSLKLLDLDNNNLRGSIPTEFGSLTGLQFLLLNRNEQITGMIPSELGDLESLRLLYLDATEVRGDMDMFCKKAENLRPLTVADCGGSSPEVACGCCAKCCVDGEDCHDDTLVPSNDPLWQFGYDRVYYTFGNETTYLLATP